jgi:organic radical activating enzyme
MIIKGIKEEDFLQYKQPSMLVAFPSCTFKCEKECPGCKGMCQNSPLTAAPNIEISAKAIVNRYMSNPISKALVCGGLEPFDTYTQLLELLTEFRANTDDVAIVYTGFYKEEIEHKLEYIIRFIPNVIIKFGRYIPDQEPHYDEILGINLASTNQYAEKIS